MTDGASYIVKTFSALSTFFPRLVHNTCVAHLLNRLCESVCEHKKMFIFYFKCKKDFKKVSKRIRKFLSCNPNVPLSPERILTRLGTRLSFVLCYKSQFKKNQGFVRSVRSYSGRVYFECAYILNSCSQFGN